MVANLVIPMPEKLGFCVLVTGYNHLKLMTVLKPTTVVCPIAEGHEDIATDVCKKCKHFTDLRELRDEHGDIGYEDLVNKGLAEGKCVGGERLIGRGLCLKGYSSEKAKILASNAKVNTPPLAFTCEIRVSVRDGIVNLNQGKDWRLYAIKSDDYGVYRKPYRLGNVFDDGKICWGNRSKPANPKVAFTRYFGSPFNGDLTAQSSTVKGYMQGFDVESVGSWERYEALSNVLDVKESDCVVKWGDDYIDEGIKVSNGMTHLGVFSSENFLSIAPTSSLINSYGFYREGGVRKDVAVGRVKNTGAGAFISFGDGNLYFVSGKGGLTAKSRVVNLGRGIEQFIAKGSKSKVRPNKPNDQVSVEEGNEE